MNLITSTLIRRQRLAQLCFVCGCQRCAAEDLSRRVQCPGGCGGYCFPCYTSQDDRGFANVGPRHSMIQDAASWRCSTCKAALKTKMFWGVQFFGQPVLKLLNCSRWKRQLPQKCGKLMHWSPEVDISPSDLPLHAEEEWYGAVRWKEGNKSGSRFKLTVVFANDVINDPYVFPHFHLSSQVNTSAAVDLVTHSWWLADFVCGGGGWGGVIMFFALATMFHATLWDLLLHLHPRFMLRYEIFSCTCTHVSCYAMRSSLALAPTFHAMLWDLLLHLHPRSCYAMRSSLALAPTFHAMLWDLLLHLHPRFVLRYEMFSCTCTHVSCYAMRYSLALAPTFHAMLRDLLLHLHPRFMLRYEIFSRTCTHVSCYAMRSSLALAPTFHATLWDLLLHLHPRFVLCYEIFSCTCTHVSCYAKRSSLALAPTFHATLWDLLLHLHPRFMLCYRSSLALALAWQVGERKRLIFFWQMIFKIHGKTQSK